MKVRDLRKKGWEACKGNWGNTFLVLVINFALFIFGSLLGALICKCITIILSAFISPYISEAVGELLASIFYILFYGHIIYGQVVFYSNLVRDNSENIPDLFLGFKKYGKIFKLYFLVQLYTTLWSMLYIIPGIIRGISYTMCYYVMKDNPDMSPKEAIKHSIKITDGYKAKYLFLQLSFIGWLLLCILSFGILIIWIGPVMSASNAAYYEYIKSKYEESLVEVSPDFYNS